MSSPLFCVSLPDNIYHRLQNHEELFNLCHAFAQNAVECIFGVFKHQFSVFKTAPEYPIDMQAMLVPALAAVHNFVGIHDRDQDNFTDQMNSTAPMQAESVDTERTLCLLDLDYVICHMVSRLTNLVMSWSQG